MEILSVLAVLARHRMLVAAGAVAAVLAGLAASGALSSPASRTPTRSAEATTRVLIDQRPSLLVDARPAGTRTIWTRAALLADLLSADDASAVVAHAAAVPRERLTIVGPSMGAPAAPLPVPERAAAAATSWAARQPYALIVRPEGTTPILSITARAPSARAARRLAAAGAVGLRSIIAGRAVRGSRSVVAERLEPVQSAAPPGASAARRALPALAAAAAFLLWCGAIVVACGAAAAWRTA